MISYNLDNAVVIGPRGKVHRIEGEDRLLRRECGIDGLVLRLRRLRCVEVGSGGELPYVAVLLKYDLLDRIREVVGQAPIERDLDNGDLSLERLSSCLVIGKASECINVLVAYFDTLIPRDVLRLLRRIRVSVGSSSVLVTVAGGIASTSGGEIRPPVSSCARAAIMTTSTTASMRSASVPATRRRIVRSLRLRWRCSLAVMVLFPPRPRRRAR